MAYPWEWQNKDRASYDKSVDPGVNKQSFAAVHSWDKYLSNLTSLPSINLALVGNSNQNAINQIVKTIMSNKLINSFVVLGLTQSIRHYIPSNFGVDKAINIKPTAAARESDILKNNITTKDIDKYNEYWYKVFYDEEQQSSDLKIQLAMLNEFVKSRWSKLIVVNNIFDCKLYSVSEAKNLGYFHIFDNNSGFSWPSKIKSYDKTYFEEHHPNTDDHNKFGHELYLEYFKKTEKKIM